MLYELLAIWFFIVSLSCASLTLLYMLQLRERKTTKDDTEERSILQPEVKPTIYEPTLSVPTLATSGLEPRSTVVYPSMTWDEIIKLWNARTPVQYPEGYEQGITVIRDGVEVGRFNGNYKAGCIKKLVKIK